MKHNYDDDYKEYLPHLSPETRERLEDRVVYMAGKAPDLEWSAAKLLRYYIGFHTWKHLEEIIAGQLDEIDNSDA